jgi:hypothetical protein
MIIFFFLLLIYIFPIFSEIFFTFDEDRENLCFHRDIQANNKIDIYSSDFYLSNDARINTNFMIGTTQKVLYLNYPFTFSNNTVNNSMKNANSAGIIFLKDQPTNTTVENLSTQKSIVPVAYFTLQELPIGWSLYCPSDYYQQSKEVTQISLYNNNIYIGKVSGPQYSHRDFFNQNVTQLLNISGKNNITLGNYSGNYSNAKLLSYNTIVGSMSGNMITGSFNSFFGTYHGVKNIINPNYLNQDYYSDNDFSNYNNAFGFGNFSLTHSTSQGLKFLANKQNNVFGNLNFGSVWRGYRNCIFGNRIMTTIVDNITQFNWIDSNIMVGNNILYESNNNLLTGLYGNIILVPNGDQAVYGGIDVSLAFMAPDKIIGTNYQTNYAIMIGSCGLAMPYQRSYKTFIANIYHSSLIDTGVNLNNSISEDKKLGFVSSTSFPVAVMINNADQLGQMELVPYVAISSNGGIDIINYDPNKEPGNVTFLNDVVDCLLDPNIMPVIGVAFENTLEARQNGLLYTVDVYGMMKYSSVLHYNPLSVFTIYVSKKLPKPYSSLSNPNMVGNINNAISSDAMVAGYEHYYLIPVLVRACQILNQKIVLIIKYFDNLQIRSIEEQNKHEWYEEKIRLLIMQQEMLIEYLDSNLQNKKILYKIKKMGKKFYK